jgi:hypothetical protein
MQSRESGDVLGDSQFFDPEKFFYAENLEPVEVLCLQSMFTCNSWERSL